MADRVSAGMYTIEHMVDRIIAADPLVVIRYDAGDYCWMVGRFWDQKQFEFGELYRGSTLRAVLEAAYHGMFS